MNEFIQIARYIKKERSRSSELVTAKILSRCTDGTGDYLCSLNDTHGTIRASRGDPSTEFVVGQDVTLSRLDGSGRNPLTAYTIQSFSSSSSRTAQVQTLAATTVAQAAQTISQIPSKVSLVAGGAAVAVLIYGTGLTTAPAYGHAGIVDNSAQVITTTLITLSVKANGGTPAGLYSIAVAGVTIPNFFEVS